MPRIRTVKPEHWSDKQLANIPMQAHLLWIGTWNFSDDEGVFEADCDLLKSQIFPRRKDVRVEQLKQWLDQLVKARFIIPFVFQNESYYVHRTFKTHQRIDKPQTSKIPAEIILRAFQERSDNDPDCIVKESESKSKVFSGEPPVKNHIPNPPGKILYWPEFVKTWFDFYKKYYLVDPTFNGAMAKNLKLIVERLKQLSEKSNLVWSEENAIRVFTKFLDNAFSDDWLKANFLLNNLYSKFDSIIQKSNPNGGKQTTGAGVNTSTAFDKIDAMPD